MMSFRLPPNYVNVPVAIVYSDLPPKYRDTYIQLRGLAWKDGYHETPPISFVELAKLFGKSASSVYEHVRFLRQHSWLQFRNAEGSAYIFSFPDPVKLSKKSEEGDVVYENSESLIPLISENIKPLIQSEKEKSEVPENRERDLGKSINEYARRDPNLSHPAVVAYRSLTHITANPVQRRAIVETVSDENLWYSTVEHWLEHGWRPMNVAGMLDSYQKGGRAGCTICNPAGSGGSSSASKATTSDINDIFKRFKNGERG